MSEKRLSKGMRDFVPILTKNGYKMVRCKGSHFIYVNLETHRHITVNKNLNKIVMLRLIRENKLEV